MLFFLFIVELVYKTSLPEKEIFANHIPDKVLISKIYKEPLKLSNKKNPTLKMGKGVQYFSKENIQMTNKHVKR